jgi:hypothetical protein
MESHEGSGGIEWSRQSELSEENVGVVITVRK